MPVEAGTYRLNRVVHPEDVEIACPPRDESELPQTFVGYDESPREYFLNSASTIVDIHTRVSDLYSSPYDQIAEQIRLTVDTIKERQESELINNPDYGMLTNTADTQRLSTAIGPPTPDDSDELITKVWKEPAFFLTHPSAVAAFGRECTRRGVPPETVSIFGAQFITWRGLPIIPSDKVPLADGRPRSCCCESANSARASSGCTSLDRGADAGPLRPVHGHQPQRHLVVPDLAVLLTGGAHPGRTRGP